MIGAHIGVSARRRRVLSPAPATDPGVMSVRADGWSVDFSSPPAMQPDVAPRFVALSRAGFDSSGAPTQYPDVLVLTQRVRQPYPNQATLDATRVALSDYVYASDVVQGGAPNASGEASPRPMAAWALPDRRTVGASLRAEVVAAHRNARGGEQIACVVFSATDGTSTVSATVATSSVLGHSADQNAVVGYAATLDLSSLADNVAVTLNAKVYPWIGGAASVLDSAVNAAGSRSFCPQLFYRSLAKASAPPLAYVSPSGVDATVLASGATSGGVQKVSTNATAAAANPFATISSAIAALKAATSLTGGACDGCEVRLMAGANATGSLAVATYTNVAELTITRDPNATQATAILSLAAAWSTRCAYVAFRDITIQRTPVSQISVNASGFATFESVAYANAGANAALLAGGATGTPVTLRAIGLSISGGAALLLQPVAAFEARLLRGVSGGALNVDNRAVLGSTFVNSTAAAGVVFADSGSFVGFNKFYGYVGAGSPIVSRADASSPLIDGMALVQNVVEWSGVNSNAALKYTADSASPSSTHIVAHNNTFAGYLLYGRANILYNETTGTLRTHKLASFRGNIHVQVNTKHDLFYGAVGNAGGDANLRVGGWAYMYGVGCAGELVQYADANSARNGTGGSFSQAYAGLDAQCGASTTIALDPKFTAPACATWSGTGTTPAAGAGGGAYTLQAGSPAAGALKAPVFRFDLAGSARPSLNDAAGAYAA